jgi:hypothetical protein
MSTMRSRTCKKRYQMFLRSRNLQRAQLRTPRPFCHRLHRIPCLLNLRSPRSLICRTLLMWQSSFLLTSKLQVRSGNKDRMLGLSHISLVVMPREMRLFRRLGMPHPPTKGPCLPRATLFSARNLRKCMTQGEFILSCRLAIDLLPVNHEGYDTYGELIYHHRRLSFTVFIILDMLIPFFCYSLHVLQHTSTTLTISPIRYMNFTYELQRICGNLND